ncbi:HAMP domain-containing sensor histidine kinase [Acetatifactor muris]|jgi:signal transduction histidine kinase|uniref:HAMP domain-containing sensor histidine kinase n=1 Tax=Acetatifactor muris TaxID=879566 RepID=UPI0023EFE6ED|nr:HAMP domain-containing sensor histidine kinase [Acetatifactor muris]
MEKIENPKSIKRAFIGAVAVTMSIVFASSALTIYGCYRMQKAILPDSQEVWLHMQNVMADGTVSEATHRFTLDEPSKVSVLAADKADAERILENTEFTIERIESSFSTLRPKQQLLYRVISVSMVGLPFIYSVIGIALCAWWFYRKKLSPPIQVLAEATKHIREQNLDFTVAHNGNDELGRLCMAFEEMRQALYDNNRQLWGIIEERRILQASVAHDLRNPIAIIEGYVEYMQQNLRNGSLDEGELQHTLSNLAITAKRLEHYTDFIRDLNALEETETAYSVVWLPDFLRNAMESLSLMAGQHSLELAFHSTVPECQVKLDEQIFYRIVENVFSNAIRYARSKVTFQSSFADDILTLCIMDDGIGFSKKMLRKRNTLFYSEEAAGGHMGLGLAISHVLSQKHGGNIKLSNIEPNGACVRVQLVVHRTG